jgi:hypothetical protein
MNELGEAARAQGETVAMTSGPLAQKADGIFDSLRALAENPFMSWEEAAVATGAFASATAAVSAWRAIVREREERGAKKQALRQATFWREADDSVVTYARLSGQTLEKAMANATGETNKFLSRSDPRIQALDIALRLPPEELEEQAAGFPKALKALEQVLPSDSGIAHNHLRLAALGKTPLEQTAAAERAAYGTLARGEAVTAPMRTACFAVLNTAAARIVRDREICDRAIAPRQDTGREQA